MNSKDKHDVLAVCINFGWVFIEVVIVCLCLFFIIGEAVMPDERDRLRTECEVLEPQWQRVMENGEKIPVKVPGTLPAEYGEVVTIVTTLPDEIYNGEMIGYRSIWQNIEIYVDGELRQSYNTENTRLFGTNSTTRYIFADLYEKDAGKELMYKISSRSKYAGRITESYIGDRTSIWLYLIKKSGSKAIVAVFLFLMSLFCIVVCKILKLVYKKKLALETLAWAIFFCALWMLSELELRQLMVKNVSVLSYYGYWSLMLIPIPIVLYINEVQNGYYKKFYVGSLVYSILMFVIGTVLQVFDVVQFVQQVPFMHIGVVIAIFMVIGTITIDVIKKRISHYLVIGIGIYGMMLTAVLELILYYVDVTPSLGTVLGLGLIFLLVMAIIKTGQDLFAFEKNRQQAIAAKEAQGKFLANMSHEIRTPINVVIGMNEMILRENDNEVISEYAQNIQSASNMLLGLVNDILDFSKIEAGQLELIDDTYSMVSLIQDQMLLLNASAAEKEISTEVKVDPQIPSKFYGDELRIKQILTNLLSNAVKYTKKGKVRLKVFFTWIDEETVTLSFSVKDTGKGIKQEDVPSLFDSFKRLELKENHKIEGTGLGLNIVKQLVELMQGDISVESVYGKGSTFTVSIPQKVIDKQPMGNIEDVLHKERKDISVPVKTFTAPNATMLVVDDNALNLMVMKELLKRTQIQTDYVTSGKECLEMTRSKVYDIILMDHTMPELDGVETLHRLRADDLNPNQNVTVIALTANAVAGSREMYLNYGFNDYFAKPIQPDKLEILLMEYLPRALVHMKSMTSAKNNGIEDNIEEEATGFSEQDKSAGELYIDYEKGLSNCMGLNAFYKDMLSEFCEQCAEYLPQLEQSFKDSDWENYVLVAHLLKEDALNIGAENFSQLAGQHELAGENKDAEFIAAEYARFVETIKNLIKEISKIK